MQYCTYEKKGHVAFVTITRPEVMNALHAFANAELDLRKPIESLTELGEQKLDLLRDKLRYRARRGR